MLRVGVDIGGTFTDVVLEIEDRRFSTKILTTYGAPEDAIISGINEVCALADVKCAAITEIVHGTTLATNALIERRGAKTALITTEGFRDVIEMRTESRFEQYDLNIMLPEPLLPRQQRYVVRERMSAQGDVLITLDENSISELADELRKEKYESIAIGFLHAYVNDAHEKRVREILAMHLPGVSFSLSSEVSPQLREYERFNTTVANAYIKPAIESYLGRLRDRLGDIGVQCPVFLMHSGGGVISLESAAQFPVRLVESGPAGGAVFAAHIAARYGLDKVLSFDMGGTTAKICLIQNQTPKTARVFEVARSYRFKKGSGMPISIPVIDMVEIGAGGGSLAHVDDMRQIRVGPQSAGSEPGPACYGRGGETPAVTDADLLLGRLDPDNFAGGSIALDPKASATALGGQIGKLLHLEPALAAYGVCEVVDENMANAARVHAVENGEDLSGYTMIAFGGAAPLHAGRLCEKLGITRALVPPGAGVGSAIGFLRAPFSYEATKSLVMRLSAFDPVDAGRIFENLERETQEFVKSCGVDMALKAEHKVYMRYIGQGSEILVPLSSKMAATPNADEIKATFEHRYKSLFGKCVGGLDIEVTIWAVNSATPLPPVDRVETGDGGHRSSSGVSRDIFDPARGTMMSSEIFKRDTLQINDAVHGPAAIVEDETTIIIPASGLAIRQPDGCIDIRIDRSAD